MDQIFHFTSNLNLELFFRNTEQNLAALFIRNMQNVTIMQFNFGVKYEIFHVKDKNFLNFEHFSL